MSATLRKALATLLPDPADSLLLRACLAGPDDCRAAWTAFAQDERPLAELFRTDKGELKRLGPLLLKNLTRHRAEVGSELLTVLRTSCFREELRARIYLSVLGQATRALAASEIECLVLRGAGLGAVEYANPAVRHSHDIDLLVADADLARAGRALTGAGLTRDPAAGEVTAWRHPNSLPVRLHTRLFEWSTRSRPFAAVHAAGRTATIGGSELRVAAPEDALAVALAHAAYSPARASLQWACDAWVLLARHPGLDPARVADALAESRLPLPALVLLRYLQELGAPVPVGLPEAVERRAGAPSPLERDLALAGARRGDRRGLTGQLGKLPRRTRLAVLGWTLFPSLEYLRWAHRPRHPALAPAYYLIRVLRTAGAVRAGRALG